MRPRLYGRPLRSRRSSVASCRCAPSSVSARSASPAAASSPPTCRSASSRSCTSVGLRPCAQVMGSSIYHVGWQQQPGAWALQTGGISQELTVALAGVEHRAPARVRAARAGGEARRRRRRRRRAADHRPARLGRGVDRVRRRSAPPSASKARRPAGAAGAHRPLGAGLLEALAGGLPSARRRRGLDRPLRRRRASRAADDAVGMSARAGQSGADATSRMASTTRARPRSAG